MQVEVDVKCMETKFGGRGFSGFGYFALAFKTAKISIRPWTIIVHGGQKIEMA